MQLYSAVLAKHFTSGDKPKLYFALNSERDKCERCAQPSTCLLSAHPNFFIQVWILDQHKLRPLCGGASD